MQGTIIRSQEQSIINEQIPNKYFYLREQQKQTKKHIKQPKNDKNELLNSNSEILKECASFYQTNNIHQNKQIAKKPKMNY